MDSIAQLIQYEELDEDFDLLEAIADRARVQGWNEIIIEALAILADRSQNEAWPRAIAVCYWAIPNVEVLPFAKMELVARLYWCLLNYPETDQHDTDGVDNLVWTIAKDLKGVHYNSDWDPLNDPEVRAHMARLD